MMVTNALLGGIADTVAQTITSVRQRAARKPGGPSADQDPVAVGIRAADRKNPLPTPRGVPLAVPDDPSLPPPFDWERLARFAGYGFCIAPLQYRWFKLLSSVFPIPKGASAAAGFTPALKRVAADQLLFAPAGLVIFFTAMTVAEGGGRRAVGDKMRNMYFPTLRANWILWPAVQVVNFRLMPVQFQLVSERDSVVRRPTPEC